MLWFIIATVITIGVTIYVNATSNRFDKFESVFGAFFVTGILSSLFVGLLGNLIASNFDANYTLITSTHDLEDFGDGKYVIAGDGEFTFNANKVQTVSNTVVTLTEDNDAIVKIGRYDGNDFMTIIDKPTLYVLAIPEDGIDF